jgi:pimeloyl-ACP methyl ester carboxylesterase
VSLAGCYYARSPTRPVPALAFRRHPEARSPCLVIFIPGLGDGPDTFVDHHFPRALHRSGARCDSVAVDATYRYYFGGAIAEVLHEDVLAPAIARGYREIWLVGISLGGLGAALLARAHPDAIAGLVLLSPFLGLEPTLLEIERAGGLAAWQPPAPRADQPEDAQFTLFVWSWLRGYVDDPDGMPPLYLAWANGERIEPGARLLAAALPEGHAFSIDGEHQWSTWTTLFGRALDVAPIGR